MAAVLFLLGINRMASDEACPVGVYRDASRIGILKGINELVNKGTIQSIVEALAEAAAFVQQHLQDSVTDVSILEVGERGLFVYGRAATNEPTALATFCSGALEALEMILPGRSAHVLWHTPNGVDYKCPLPTARRKLPAPETEASE